MATSTDLRAAIEEVQSQLPAEQLEDQLLAGGLEAEWATRLERRVGALPWWVISAAVHAVIFLLATLLTVAVPPAQLDEVTITTDVAKQKPPEYDENKKRDLFKNPNEIKAEQQVERPMVVHEEAPVQETFETANEMDKQTSRGQEDAISDIPLGGTGVSGSIGVGGGGMAGCFGYRDGGGRKHAVARFGGSPATESAVEAALRWLQRHQEADGHWEIRKWEGGGSVCGGLANDSACTALSLLAYLGAGHTHRTGNFRDTVNRSVEWLLKNQRPDGGWGEMNQASGYEMYASTLGTLALAEAYGMTRDARFGTSAQKGVDYILKVQDKYAGWHHGGLRSTSVVGWAVMALKSAKIAGLKVDGVGFQGATNWLDKVTDRNTGKVGYNGPGQYQFEQGYAMTAVGMVCRQFMGTPAGDAMLVKQADLLTKELPKWRPNSNVHSDPQEPYYWYYGTLAMFQTGGRHWQLWNEALKPTLVNNQCKGGPLDGSAGDKDGSWDCEMGWGPTGGRVYHTAINALSLEVYYRYLPMYAK